MVTVLPAQEEQWKPVEVPGGQKVNDYAWFRTWLLPNKYFFVKHERDLFRESVSMTVRGVSGAHEVFVNGQKIGTGGAMPPEYRDGRDLNLRHKIPPGLIQKDKWNEIAFRVYHPEGEGGFTSEAPVVVTYFDECKMAGVWEYQAGDAPLNSKGALSEKPATSSFETFKLATTALGEAEKFTHGPKLSPEESLKKFTTADDLVIEQLLHEPVVAQPNHFSFDGRGRLWVAQYRQYPYPAGLKVLSRDQYYRSVFDKVPLAPPNHSKGRDVVSIHEDTNGDGQFDKNTVFQDGLNLVSSALPGAGGVWVMNPPYLLFYPDENGDDVPDSDPVVHLTGFGLEDIHSVANALTFGPDGWIYAAQGSTTSSRVLRPGIDDDASGIYFEGPMVWRYHPTTHEYEIFAEGGGNVFGLEFDNEGQLFSGNNGGDTRGWHYVQGASFGVEAANKGKYGPSPHPYNFGELRKIPSEQPIKRFSHIAAVVEGTALPEKYQDHFFSIDPLHNNVIDSERFPLGSSFRTSDLGDIVNSADEGFRPVNIGNAPDGSIYIADFYEHYIAHGQHYQSQIDPTSGRIYRLRGKDSKLEKPLNLQAMDDAGLIGLLSHPNKWHRRMAVRLLGERGDSGTAKKLSSLLAKDKSQTALEALWALHQISGLDDEAAKTGLSHVYTPVREWTVRLLGDGKEIPEALAPLLVKLATDDDSPQVRRQLACTARRLPADQALPIAKGLMMRDEDATDPFIPQLVWWAIEEQIDSAPEQVIALLDNAPVWDAAIVFNDLLPRLMRRFAMAGKRADLLACAQFLTTAPSEKHSQQLLTGFNEAFRGRGMTGLPDELLTAMSRFGKAPLLMRVRQGEPEAMKEALALVKDAKAEIGKRVSMIRALGELSSAPAKASLLSLATLKGLPQIQMSALAALGNFADTEIAEKVIQSIPKLAAEVQPAALTLLANRKPSTEALLTAIEAGKVSTTLITPDIADRFRLHPDEAIQTRARKLFPVVGTGDEAAAAMIKKVEAALAEGLGSAYEGEKIYATKCASCHLLFHKGGQIGPNLTNYQRDNLGTMLISIVNPNAEIREGFEYMMVTTKGGRNIGGFLAENDGKVTVLRGLDGQDITLKQEEIEEMKSMGRSLMPDGLLNDLDDEQIRNLFAFLRLSQPISR